MKTTLLNDEDSEKENIKILACKTMKEANLKHFAYFIVKCQLTIATTDIGLRITFIDMQHMRKIGRVKEKIELINKLRT